MTVAIVWVAILIVIGVMVRQCASLFRWLHIPGSVIGGFVGLGMALMAGAMPLEIASQWASEITAELSSWPKWLIAVVFAGMLMERRETSAGDSIRRAARQGLMVWIIVLGETAIGLLAVWLLVQPSFNVPNSFGMLIETGFAGGHGTAAAMGEVFAHPTIDLRSGQDLGMLMATCGLVYGIVSGIFWINLGKRRNWILSADGVASDEAQLPLGRARIAGETVDPLLLQVVWLAIAFGLGMILQQSVLWSAGWLDQQYSPVVAANAASGQLSKRLSVTSVVDFPLFIYTLFGGWMVRCALNRLGGGDLIDNSTISRLTSTAMDILVVAAIASLNLGVAVSLATPFLILFAAGAIWTAVCLLLLSRWILPSKYWFQLGLTNYGMSTGTTATGFVLLRMVDPELRSGAAEDYALAAPLSAPFIGGGILTVALPLLLLERVTIFWPAVTISAVVVILTLIGIYLKRREIAG